MDYKILLERAAKSGVDMGDPGAVAKYLETHAKDTMTGTRNTTGNLYQNSPFSANIDEPLSLVISGGSPLMNWIPSRLVDYRYEAIAHIEFVTPEGMDGSQTYRDYLAALEIAECDYGPTAVWSGFEYQQEGGTWSFQSPVLKHEDFGMRDYEKSPIYTVRGDNAGLVSLKNDADWATARALLALEGHMNYNLLFGDRNNSVMEMDGLATVIDTNYVQNRRVGPGTPHWANPTVVNGATLGTPKEVLAQVRALVDQRLRRARMKGWSVAPGDIAVVLPSGMWQYLAEEIAKNGGYTGVEVNNYRDFASERSRINQGGLGYGFIEVSGRQIPIIPDDGLGVNTTIAPGTDDQEYGISGDIFVLVRRASGITLLEQQYIDWTKLNTPADEEKFTLFGGSVRGGWKILNNKCFQYYVEMGGRLVTYFQPMQARLNNVFLPTTLVNENESPFFWNQDFYAFDGQRGGNGTPLLNTF